jgi:tripartite-type tricarboxylate transporter receptor subunit TctC
MNQAIIKAIQLPDVKERLLALGYDSVGSSPYEFVAQIRAEVPKWAKVIREAGIKVA